ncbi:hypothetical protein ABZZ20_11570 [Streptomyces sp. NPDC006430]|uniref:hypothetical protein n=1 Tax=Streptomyces sp. NPDC006430 TaxID=3154299 RepID=UPI0033A7A3E2
MPKNADLAKTLVTAAKKTEQRAFLSDAPVGVLQQTLRDLDAAWKAHEDSKTGLHRGPKVQPPRFKSRKDNRQSARFTKSDRWSITEDGRLRLPKIGDVRVKWTRDLPSAPTSVTLIKENACGAHVRPGSSPAARTTPTPVGKNQEPTRSGQPQHNRATHRRRIPVLQRGKAEVKTCTTRRPG